MILPLILGLSLLLQVVAAVLALRLILITRRYGAWILITAATMLMTVRRALLLAEALGGGGNYPGELSAELIGLMISALLVAGIGWIAPQFLAMKRTEERQRRAASELEDRINEQKAALAHAAAAMQGQIAERAEIEGALRDEHDFSAAVLETASAPIVVFDAQGYIIRFNRACEELSGYTFNEVKDRPFWTILPAPEDAERVGQTFRRFVDKGQPAVGFEYHWLTKAGERRLITWSGSLLLGADGGIRYVIGAGIDVTEQRRAEKALHESYDLLERRVEERTAELKTANEHLQLEIEERQRAEEWLRVLINAIPDIVCFKDGEGRWMIANDADLKLFRLEGVDYRGKKDAELVEFSPFYRDSFLTCEETDEQAWRTGSISSSEEAIPVPDDLPRIFDVVKIPLFNPDGSRRGLVVIGRDITERKQAEEERETLIRELDAFAHTVAHDLKNPLNLILGFATALETEAAALDADELHEYLRTISWSGRKMGNIINELLLLAGIRKIEEVETSPLNMERIVREVLIRLSYMVQEMGGKITLPQNWPKAWGYASWVEEVWANYISNGLKYGGKPPMLELGADELPDGQVRFWVRDNGNGLTVEEQAHLFTPFTKLNQIRVQGHGLGLSIVQRIVERLGGRVGAESAPGRGSTFYFTLPRGEDSYRGGGGSLLDLPATAAKGGKRRS